MKAVFGFPLAMATALLLVSCGKNEDAAPANDSANDSNVSAPAEPAVTNAVTPAAFDINSIPLSNKPLGAFPYITLPSGYTAHGRTDATKDFARFPFWVNGKAHWVEGRFHEYAFSSAEGKQFSQFEVTRNIEALVEQMGGVKISQGQIPGDTVRSWGEEITQGFRGLGDVYNVPATTYLIRRADGNIWIHYVADTAMAWLVIGQEKSFAPTAQLLPAATLKQQLDAAGRVSLQVNFATDKADILPDSLPQIEQVAQLLTEDPALTLQVNGHADGSGDAAHNRQLSEARARSVVAMLTGKGIAATRLKAAGFGADRPTADNATDAGRAQNRRVELVKG